ncbi:MAG TPA: hypothetical protein VH561_05450 [Micromonosporaceae bacterium]
MKDASRQESHEDDVAAQLRGGLDASIHPRDKDHEAVDDYNARRNARDHEMYGDPVYRESGVDLPLIDPIVQAARGYADKSEQLAAIAEKARREHNK